MPKPTKPDKDKGQPGPSVDKFVSKGWTALTVPPGATESDTIQVDPETEELHVNGNVFGEDGKKLKGRERPHIRVEEREGEGAVVSFAAPQPEAVTVLYRIVSSDPDELDDTLV